MKNLFKFIVKRAKERSTYIGIFSLLGAVGVGVNPEMADAIIAIGVGASGLVSILIPDRKLPEGESPEKK